ncbi:PREDICTED: uncharacterized protein LOC109581055 isoform X2 [Amphimedon queenslandica]|uniref:SRCR domain-containing protein n=1 Tax=Amphimedon queenslandica TaxID=400682 RepID=A0AAN0J030_AMPQE|nr:PREDICTED: uncharacterized protein LOC109581055 isoform X2 [Amphimedon queenslandica]|eukprot:XP_019850365.1 PREDICTED: uncharacterized protein LOC109581055 isoform X2 [Amphimedon queenslandica]
MKFLLFLFSIQALCFIANGATYFAGPLHSYGEGTGPILLDDVQCSGNECSLLNCSHTAIIYGCSHSEDVGVSCPPLDTCTPFNSIPSPTASTIMSSKTCTRECPTPTTPLASIVFTVTTTLTLSVTATTTEAGTIASAVDNCTASVTSAIILPVLLLIIIAILVLISLTLIYYYKIRKSDNNSASIANSVEPVPLDAVGSNRYHTSNNRATDIPQYEMTTAAYEYVDNEPAYDRPSNDNKNRSVSDPYETIPGEEDK